MSHSLLPTGMCQSSLTAHKTTDITLPIVPTPKSLTSKQVWKHPDCADTKYIGSELKKLLTENKREAAQAFLLRGALGAQAS